jgi:hypothetical protein
MSSLIRSGLVLAALTSLAFAAGCAGTDGAAGQNSLNRVIPEAAGANCPAGGQAIQFGLDANENSTLDDEEVKGSAYACNGESAKLTTAIEPIASGDPRCAGGGSVLKLTGSATQDIVVCNGSDGLKGDTGAAGATGATGATGAKGDPPATPALGRFLATQVVGQAVLTCAAQADNGTTISCTGLKLNGMDVRLAPADAGMICNAVSGKGYSSASGMGQVSQFISWNGTAWAIGTTTVSPMNNLTCNK